MPLILTSDRAVFGTAVPIDSFPSLVRAHDGRFKQTETVEALGEEIIRDGFSPVLVSRFVREVCDWGGYAGISGRVLKRNTASDVAGALRSAYAHLCEPKPNVAAALSVVNTLNGLGTPSFASKHLRFLSPKQCPVFDSILQESLPYSFDAGGYTEFARDCSELAATLTASALPGLERRPNRAWFVADVEASLYAQITGLEGAA